MVIKSQPLADFVAEWSDPGPDPNNSDLASRVWTISFDGSLTLTSSGAGVVIISPTGEKLQYVIQLHFPMTNNVTEYEGLFARLRDAVAVGIKHLRVLGDSQLVVK